MSRMLSVLALALAVTIPAPMFSYAGEQPSSPTDSKDKKGSSGHLSMEDQKDKKKDDKVGR